MYVIREIKGKIYRNLIEYSSTQCDAVMFIVRKDLYLKNLKEFRKFSNLMDNFNNNLKGSLLKKRKGAYWVYSKVCANNDLFDVYFYKFDSSIKTLLLQNDSFYQWLHPLYPEDIAFFKNGYCWFYSVAHEEICEIYYESETQYKELLKMGVVFDEKYILPHNQRYYEEY